MRNQTDFGTITGFGTLIAIIGFALIGPSEQRTDNNPKNDLTGKAPYRFESVSLQRGICCERHFRGAFHRRTEGWNPARSKLLRSGCGKRISGPRS